MGQDKPEFRDVIAAIFGRDFDPDTIHVAYFQGDPHNKEDARWHGMRLSSVNLHLNFGPPPEANHFICMGVLDREKIGRSLAHVVGHVAFWMDDVGTKVPRERVDEWIVASGQAPTLVIETSPGNFSYVWALERPVPADGGFEDQTVAAVRHRLKTDGWGDPAAQDAARYMRSGFGVNGKKAYAGPDGAPWQVRIEHFDPDAKVSAASFALSILGPKWPEEVATGAYKTSAQLLAGGGGGGTGDRRASMDDPLVRLAEFVGLDPQPSTRPGVIDAHCPNEAAHTGGDPTGFAFINDGMCYCHHASCQHLNSMDFRDMMVAEYDGRVAALEALGVCDDDPKGSGLLVDTRTGELLPRTGGAFLAKARYENADKKTGETPESLKAQAREISDTATAGSEAREAERAAGEAALLKRFVWVADAGLFYDRARNKLVSDLQLERDPDVLKVFPLVSKAEKRAVWQLLNSGRVETVDTVVVRPYRADQPPQSDIIPLDTSSQPERAINRFKPTRIGFAPGVPTKFLDHMNWLFDAPTAQYVLEYMAFRLQHPDVQTPVVLVIGGAPGIGKDTPVLTAFFELLGVSNVTMTTGDKLNENFNEMLLSPNIYMNEFSLDNSTDKRAYNRLKEYTSGSALKRPINPKYGKKFDTDVMPHFLASTNDRDGIRDIDKDDRRLMIAWSNAQRRHEAGSATTPGTNLYYADLVPAYSSKTAAGRANLAVLHQYLMNLPLKVFNPAAAPPRSMARHEVMREGLGPVARFVYDLVMEGDFADRKVISFDEIEARCLASPNKLVSTRVSPLSIRKGLSEAGCEWIARTRIDASRPQLWTGSCLVLEDGKTAVSGALTPTERDDLRSDVKLATSVFLAETKAAADALLP